jgi:hypothetical protein
VTRSREYPNNRGLPARGRHPENRSPQSGDSTTAAARQVSSSRQADRRSPRLKNMRSGSRRPGPQSLEKPQAHQRRCSRTQHIHPLRISSPLATKWQQEVFAAWGARKAGKTTAKVPAVQVLFDNMPDDGAPVAHPGNGEAVLFFVALVRDALEFVEVVLYQAIQAGGLGVSGPIDSLENAFHKESNCPMGTRANFILGSIAPHRIAECVHRKDQRSRSRRTCFCV